MNAKPQTTKTILVVEDDNIILLNLSKILRSKGYKVLGFAGSASEAVNSALTNKPDLIMMDIRLKGETDGIDAAIVIKQKLNIPIIFVSAYSEKSYIDKLNQLQDYSYIKKPFEADDILKEVNRYIEQE